ncbi:hypothetical protein TUMSATVNIG1_41490 [Vibrio nigripulchritudo]|uniref:hypothetical protein n=1 Tax=Vibrio nigripulchritudo TaxID=28173 RepID=UPI001909EB8F|nr:hypothetical protein [Vibrio nigripulchritudo]BCL72182.1 hypothetical protein VNTUMSATTG_41190 [Vibrio nigripulchritudo]BDU33540.1 hypothetical protein TUMSATVNIG1_41490 [Vibrio nigripulchritudo]
MDFKLTFPFAVILKFIKKSIKWFRRTETQEHGKLDVSKVVEQGAISSFTNNNSLNGLTVGDLNKYFLQFVEKNIDTKYLKDGSLPPNVDRLPDEQKIKFIINNTRISTFFSFTDGSKILLLNRSKTTEGYERLKNTKYDVFGSVSFENSTIKLKLSKNDFLKSKVKSIEGIPGLAFEDTVEPDDNLLGRQTVIMIGFSILLSPEDFMKAESSSAYTLETFELSSLPDSELLTSKSKLSIDYLLSRNA